MYKFINHIVSEVCLVLICILLLMINSNYTKMVKDFKMNEKPTKSIYDFSNVNLLYFRFYQC